MPDLTARPDEQAAPDSEPLIPRVIELGRVPYREAYALQRAHHAEVLESRRSGEPEAGRILVVEHDAVITVTRKPGVAEHVLASPEVLDRHGVAREQTDRGGDVTYHGPGQIVVYPIIDLRAIGRRLHEYLRVLEDAIMRTIGSFGIGGVRDPGATGVWVPDEHGSPDRKIAAIGVRVERWITLHGLALNVRPDLSHFGLIVPCGLAGRPVTSMHAELAEACPSVEAVRARLTQELTSALSSTQGT